PTECGYRQEGANQPGFGVGSEDFEPVHHHAGDTSTVRLAPVAFGARKSHVAVLPPSSRDHPRPVSWAPRSSPSRV
ncbi:hypothetical protein, partial [Escherichia coli]|uniref:hypothetical protein n=1 Tax=Escherichia coli TaxID=562 RepID=UPI00195465D9